MTKCYQCDEMFTLESNAIDARCTDCLKLNQQVNEAENLNLREELAEVKRSLVHFRAKAKRLNLENVNQRINLRNYRKYLGRAQDAISDLQDEL